MSTETYALTDPPTDLPTITANDNALVFPTFTSQTAWDLGALLRSRLLTFPSGTCVSINLANGTPLFYAATKAGTVPDNTFWVARKQKTVLRFGCSTWFMHNKYQGDEALFASKLGLGSGVSEYAIHGGGFPIRVKGVEGLIGVIVVSGLKQNQDHQIIVQTVRDFLGAEADLDGEKRKED